MQSLGRRLNSVALDTGIRQECHETGPVEERYVRDLDRGLRIPARRNLATIEPTENGRTDAHSWSLALPAEPCR